MTKIDKIIEKFLTGRSDSNIKFNDIVHLLEHPGFEVRMKGSHHLFRKTGMAEKINLQKEGNHAKAYQVRQVGDIILKYNFGSE